MKTEYQFMSPRVERREINSAVFWGFLITLAEDFFDTRSCFAFSKTSKAIVVSQAFTFDKA